MKEQKKKNEFKIDKKKWQVNYDNPSLSGIELRDAENNLISFITIKYDFDTGCGAHRIVVPVNKKLEPIFPKERTFEERIQDKRRLQSKSVVGLSTTSSARRSQAYRRRKANERLLKSNAIPTQEVQSELNDIPAEVVAPAKCVDEPEEPIEIEEVNTTAIASDSSTVMDCVDGPQAEILPQSSKLIERVDELEAGPSRVDNPSVKDFERSRRSDPKKLPNTASLKYLLKQVSPGSKITLADGTVIKKSRRGGARAGAGRKRTRDTPK